jgi:micrococcal nuclease
MWRCIVSTICGSSRSKAETIAWKDCVPFVPPITSGYVIKVYDGDTITIAGRLPYPESRLYRFQVRLLGIDSPEIKGKTEKEKEAAHRSQQALEGLVLNKTVLLREISTEKYGRILANVYLVTETGQELLVNKWMLTNGHAVPYDGKTKQPFDSDS